MADTPKLTKAEQKYQFAKEHFGERYWPIAAQLPVSKQQEIIKRSTEGKNPKFTTSDLLNWNAEFEEALKNQLEIYNKYRDNKKVKDSENKKQKEAVSAAAEQVGAACDSLKSEAAHALAEARVESARIIEAAHAEALQIIEEARALQKAAALERRQLEEDKAILELDARCLKIKQHKVDAMMKQLGIE